MRVLRITAGEIRGYLDLDERGLTGEGGELEGEDGDVVFLAEFLGGFGDLLGGLVADLAGSFESVEFALGVAGFEDAVGEEGEFVAGVELERFFGVFGGFGDAEGQAGFEGDFFAVAVGREVAGICNRESAIWGDVGAEAGDEDFLASVDDLLAGLFG